MRLCARFLICLCLLNAVLVAPSSATQVVYRNPQQLGQDAEVVVRGRVLGSDAYWNDKHSKIFTVTRVAVDEAYKGSPRSTIDLVQLGGVVGNVKVTVSGALQWEPGEEVLVFAEPYDAGTFQVAGFCQGKFPIERDPRTAQVFVRAPAASGVTMLGAPQGQARTAGTERIPLDEFIRQALGRR